MGPDHLHSRSLAKGAFAARMHGLPTSHQSMSSESCGINQSTNRRLKDRSLGSVELKIADLAQRADDPKYPYASTGKKSYAEPIRLDRGNVYKGQLHYDAQFVPAAALKWTDFDSEGTELDRIAEFEDDGDRSSTGTYEREKIPEGVTTVKSMSESPEETPEPPEQANGNGGKARHSKKESVSSIRTTGTTGTTNTTGTGGTMETAATGPPPTAAIEMTKEELFGHRS